MKATNTSLRFCVAGRSLRRFGGFNTATPSFASRRQNNLYYSSRRNYYNLLAANTSRKDDENDDVTFTANSTTTTSTTKSTTDTTIINGLVNDANSSTNSNQLPPSPLKCDEIEAAFTPKQIVAELDKFIVGQSNAKRAVAIALRNRWRRKQLAPELAAEIIPKNILMVGPTGCGKTEIARRIAKLSQAPFIKVEATKFTEVGFKGRDVESIVKDLVDVAVQDMTLRAKQKAKETVNEKVEDKLLSLLTGEEITFATSDSTTAASNTQNSKSSREDFRHMLRSGLLDERLVEVPASMLQQHLAQVTPSPSTSQNPLQNNEFLQRIIEISASTASTATTSANTSAPAIPQTSVPVRRMMTVAECRPLIEEACMGSQELKDIPRKAIDAVQNHGIVFFDEIDKICLPANSYRSGMEASSEGVQRDLLPLIEGTTVSTKYGNVDTTKILFIASGAFMNCRPSDLLPELQGRLPIRVNLNALSENDLYRVLTETKNNQIDQAEALMKTENVNLKFTDGAIRSVAHYAQQVNDSIENIGARRLHTIIERVLEEVSFESGDAAKQGETAADYLVDEKLVQQKVGHLVGPKMDLTKFVL